jgi:ribonuclease Z
MLTKTDVMSRYDIRVSLLGTGGPELSVDRLGSATLIEAGPEILLFDAGRGVMQRLFECSVPINAVTKVIFTHLHSDHIEGLPNLWITPWFLLGRKALMEFRGPLGTAAMLDGMRKFLGKDVVQRAESGQPSSDLDFSVHEFDEPGVVYAANGLTVAAVPVDHKDGNPAFGFVIDYRGRRVILSGDCTFSEELANAGPADLVVHNVFAPSPELLARDPFKKIVAEKLASPEQAAEVFRRTQAKLGVYTHVIRLDSTYEDILKRTRSAGFDGPLIVGADRMKIHVGDKVEVLEPTSLNDLAEVTGRGHG